MCQQFEQLLCHLVKMAMCGTPHLPFLNRAVVIAFLALMVHHHYLTTNTLNTTNRLAKQTNKRHWHADRARNRVQLTQTKLFLPPCIRRSDLDRSGVSGSERWLICCVLCRVAWWCWPPFLLHDLCLTGADWCDASCALPCQPFGATWP